MAEQKQYIGFAKKYRPGKFIDLKGQDVLVKILSYAIINDRLAGGYLLTGIRGVGKTTSARIIAKTVNCTDVLKEGDNISPCTKCKNCLAFESSNHPDVLEIDAASRTGVDDVRVIIESSEYKSLLGKYKIFIIDEIHMLSKSAFNALLKVLEEPPLHVIFIFATTEIHKLPITVVSRCQRFDLKRLRSDEISDLLNAIVNSEKLQIDKGAIDIISSACEGSARDAISLLDQAVNIKIGETITSQTINNILGAIDLSVIIKFLELIIDNNLKYLLKLLNKVYMDGGDLELFIISELKLIAYLSKLKLIPDYQLSLYTTYQSQINDIAAKTNIYTLSILWQIFSLGLNELKTSHNGLICAEMLVIKAIYSCNIDDIKVKEQSLEVSNCPNIADFLKYLSASNESEIYYALMNEFEIKNFTDKIFEIGGIADSKFRLALREMLFKWSGREYEINITRQDKILSFKEKLIEDIKKSPEWQKINRFFPLANISDILSSK